MEVKLKNIIFDLGAVLLDIDYEKTSNAFRNLGYNHFDEMYSKFKGNHIFDKLETGQITNEEFFRYMRSASDRHNSEEEIRNAWNAMLLDFRKTSFNFLEKLAPRYRLFLLSNTNAIHQLAFERRFSEQFNQKTLDDFFHKVYFSNEIGYRKPDPEIFSYIIEDSKINPEESLFIDDIPANTKSAESLGFNTHVLLPSERIELLNYDLISS